MPRHIGIVACSAEGAALCYRTLCTEGPAMFGRYAHPEISLHSPSFGAYMTAIEAADWDAVASLMLNSAEKLAGQGADFLICPDNTIHQALPRLTARSPLPWLHIAEIVADEAHGRGFKRVGITGTQWLVESEVYPEKLAARGLDWARPDTATRHELNRIIMDELVAGRIVDASVKTFLKAIDELKAAQCDAVVLGCTEIPLIISDGNSSLPTLDSTRLLARAALRHAAS